MALRSNVGLFSNVYLREDSSLATDERFYRQVRGRTAITRTLSAIAPGLSKESAAKTYLTPSQRAELGWQVRCATCGAFPLGLVRRNGRIAFEFRCPLYTCPRERAHRLLFLDFDIVDRLARRLGAPTHVAALQNVLNDSAIPLTPGYVQNEAALAQYPARMSWTDYYSLRDEDIEAELVRIIEEH